MCCGASNACRHRSPEEMLSFPVSPRVNAPTVDDEKCIAPLSIYPAGILRIGSSNA